MCLLRFLLILTVLGVIYIAAVLGFAFPALMWVYGAILLALILKRGKRAYSSYGTARWAKASDIPHLLDGDGVILGTLIEVK